MLDQRGEAMQRKEATEEDGLMKEPNSPVCHGESADPGYMGYLEHNELLAFLNQMLEAERAGARVGMHMVKDTCDPGTRSLARAIQRDEARWCAMLRRTIRELGGIPSEATGTFYEKAIAIADLSVRFKFLNRGQGWVVRKLRAVLPKIRDDGLHNRLTAMLAAHEANIKKVAAFADPKA